MTGRPALDPGFFLALAAVSALLAARADEMTFIDVFASDKQTVHYLDAEVVSEPGAAQFHTDDPMLTHDWATQSFLRRTFSSELAASAATAGVARARIRQLEQELAPLWQALPKNAVERLDGSTARYAIHRYFRQARGWAIKGIEPAAAAFLAATPVTEDVRQINKYIAAPFLLNELLSMHGPHDGVDLRHLAVMVATLEHLIRAAASEQLYFVYFMLEFPTSGQRSEEDINRILTAYLATYALGLDTDISTAADAEEAVEYLDGHHAGWQDLQKLLAEVLAKQPKSLDFFGVLHLTEKLAEKYSHLQNMVCAARKLALAAAPGVERGRVPLPPNFNGSEPTSGRAAGVPLALPWEPIATLRNLGAVVGEDKIDRPGLDVATGTRKQTGVQLLVANYLSSQSMCVATASYYKVCCQNQCEALLGHLEREFRAPSVPPTAAANALRAAAVREALEIDATVADAWPAALEEIAQATGGSLQIHGRPFADFLHRAWPFECPAPHDDARLGAANPASADEWLAPVNSSLSSDSIEELIYEVAAATRRFTAMGGSAEALTQWQRKRRESHPDADAVGPRQGLEVEAKTNHGPPRRTSEPSLCSGGLGPALAVVSMLGLVVTACRSGLSGGAVGAWSRKGHSCGKPITGLDCPCLQSGGYGISRGTGFRAMV